MKTQIFLSEGIYFANNDFLESEKFETIEISKKEFFKMLKEELFFDISKNTEISDSRFYPETTPVQTDLSTILKRLEALETENRALKTKKINFSDVQKAFFTINEKKEEIEIFESVLSDLQRIEQTHEETKSQKLIFASHFFSQNKKEISISNSYVIFEFVNYLINKIVQKIEDLRENILEIEKSF